ncbi:MAG: thioredoxin domain-containing protein [Bacteroidota bacterium]
MEKHTNRLALSASPYLLQHAQNPVDWYPWGDEALKKAKEEDKLLLVSIGYSACHWCHVMEHECFEDHEVAALMNDFFVCIKVDREERPDIDQVYMAAVQLLTGRGGWPLNCFALPDGRPVYGGTYFPKKQWMELMGNLASMYRNDRKRLEDYASQLTNGVASSDTFDELVEGNENTAISIREVVENWKRQLDFNEGGPDRAPKFPLPNNYIFLLRYATVFDDSQLAAQVRLTLKKMAFGGIYDQIGGGFARYSVDGIWKVPHFEKMLYDNAQLMSLYSEGFLKWKDTLYRDVVYQTADFMEREWLSPEGGFYSALDADSEGEEGRYYVWNEKELRDILGTDWNLASTYFNFNERGFWEHGNHIPLRHDEDEDVSNQFGISIDEMRKRVEQIREKLLTIRESRIKPGLDDKRITSWNALSVSGFVSAFISFQDDRFLNRAKIAFEFISNQMSFEGGGLYHSWKPGSIPVNGFLEDYAFSIAAATDLYKVTLDHFYLEQATKWMHYALAHFHDPATGLFYFNSDLDAPLFVRKFEYQDNVIASSCSQMAKNLAILSYYTGFSDWEQHSNKMLSVVAEMAGRYGSSFSNWLDLALFKQIELQEVVICGTGYLQQLSKLFATGYFPYLVVDGCGKEEKTPATLGRLKVGELRVYHCYNKVCGLPKKDVNELHII